MLTDRQREILDYYIEFEDEHGYTPTLVEVGAHFSVTHANICFICKKLGRMGLMEHNPKKYRGWRPVRNDRKDEHEN